jgi:hypothetical protein
MLLFEGLQTAFYPPPPVPPGRAPPSLNETRLFFRMSAMSVTDLCPPADRPSEFASVIVGAPSPGHRKHDARMHLLNVCCVAVGGCLSVSYAWPSCGSLTASRATHCGRPALCFWRTTCRCS